MDLCEVRREEEVALVGPRTAGPDNLVDVDFGLCGPPVRRWRGEGAVRQSTAHLPLLHAPGHGIDRL